MGVSAPVLRALAERGYVTPTPIQRQAIPHLIAGRDLLGVAQTGTGKTAAFALPSIQWLAERNERAAPGHPRALILTPTRELASQIAEALEFYGRYLSLRTTVVFGGVGKGPQVRALRRGVDVLVATPGRLLDLMGEGEIHLKHVDIFVLDEADRMLDMGFLRDVRRIVDALPGRRQSLLFSATMPPDIADLGRSLLYDPVRVEVTPPSTTVERIAQCVYFVPKAGKRWLLLDLLRDEAVERALVFSRTKHGANRIVKQLAMGGIEARALHGNKSQGQRERALAAFRDGEVRVLIATDIAARGLDVRGISHVINFDLPNIPESYVHRIGRTARAGKGGIAISFCDESERGYLKDIERQIRMNIDVAETPKRDMRTHGDVARNRGRSRARQRGGRRRR